MAGGAVVGAGRRIKGAGGTDIDGAAFSHLGLSHLFQHLPKHIGGGILGHIGHIVGFAEKAMRTLVPSLGQFEHPVKHLLLRGQLRGNRGRWGKNLAGWRVRCRVGEAVPGPKMSLGETAASLVQPKVIVKAAVTAADSAPIEESPVAALLCWRSSRPTILLARARRRALNCCADKRGQCPRRLRYGLKSRSGPWVSGYCAVFST